MAQNKKLRRKKSQIHLLKNSKRSKGNKVPLDNKLTDIKSLKSISSTGDLARAVNKLRLSGMASAECYLLFTEIENWQSFGYRSRKHFIQEELPDIGYNAALMQMHAARITKSLFGVECVGMYSMNAMRVFGAETEDGQKALRDAIQVQWKSETGEDSIICPKWLTARKVIEVKAMQAAEEVKETDTSGCISEGDVGLLDDDISNVSERNKIRVRKLTSMINKLDGEKSLADLLAEFIVREYYYRYGDKLPEKFRQLTHKHIKTLKQENAESSVIQKEVLS